MSSRSIAMLAGCVLALLAGLGALAWRHGTQSGAGDAQSAGTRAPPPTATSASGVAATLAPAESVAAGALAVPGRPSFDIVRVEPTGDTLVAGRAMPGAEVSLLADGRVVAGTKADDSGAFVLLPGTLTPGAHALALRSTAGGVAAAGSSQDVAVSVPDNAAGKVAVALQEPGRPTVLLTDPTASAEPPAAARPVLSFKTAEVQAGQSFYATGAAAPGARVRLYLNGSPLRDLTAGPDGQWSVQIGSGVRAGQYALRADAVDAGGKVVARAEVPFTAPDLPTASATSPGLAATGPTALVPAIQTRTVGRGDNLWVISRKALGQGNRYTQIYAANTGQIRDPGLIYPGQVFVLPGRTD